MPDTAPAHVPSIDLVYAAALLDLAQEGGQLDAIAQEAGELAKLLKDSPDLARLMESRVLSIDERAQALGRIFKGRVSDLLYRFLQVVNTKNRLGQFGGILYAFDKLMQERHGIVEVEATVAQELDAQQVEEVAQRLGGALKRRVVVRQHVDAELIGGLKLRIADEVVDGSVAAQLRILKEKMIASGREKAATMIG